MKEKQLIMQVGKSGVSENLINTLNNAFKNHTSMKIIVLKSARQGKDATREISEKILSALGNKYTAKTIGFSIFLKKWRKSQNRASKSP
ncbi:MAG: YhbY family RNA-binding protein [Nanoarchaeota archaeon]